MKLDKNTMLLYAVTDRSWTTKVTLEEQVEQALKSGITFLQLREKDLTQEEFLEEAKQIQKLAKKYNIPFVINDNVDIALKSNADGVHVGQKDTEAVRAREILGKDKIIGVSVQTVEQAILAQSQGADYLGVGAVFATATKQDAKTVAFDTLKEICQSVSIPVVAIGGIGQHNILKLRGSKIQGVAVVTAIFASEDIENATKELLMKAKDIVNE